MLVTPPRVPPQGTGELDALLDSLGFPALADLDEESQVIAETHDALSEEISALARRGWVTSLDCTSQDSMGADEYDEMLVRLLRPLGVRRVDMSSRFDSMEIDDDTFVIRAPDLANPWWDLGWLDDTVAPIAAERGFVFLYEADSADYASHYALIPEHVWNAITAKDLAGCWRLVVPNAGPRGGDLLVDFSDDFDDDDDPSPPDSGRLMN